MTTASLWVWFSLRDAVRSEHEHEVESHWEMSCFMLGLRVFVMDKRTVLLWREKGNRE